MNYIPVDITHVRRNEWTAYVTTLDDFVHESSKPRLEHEVYRRIEETQGLHSFNIVWREV